MFFENLENLCRQNKITPTALAKRLGLSTGSPTSWKNGKVPRHGTLVRIAEFFDVSVDFLLGNEKEKSPIEKSNLIFFAEQNVHMAPLFENVSAGFGTSAIDYVVDYIPMYVTTPDEAKNTICIKVVGDSMYPKIEDGDIIQVHKQESVDSGSIAVVLVDGEEALVKKIVYGETWIELHSFNPLYKTMRFNGEDVMRIRVLGLVKKVIKTV